LRGSAQVHLPIFHADLHLATPKSRIKRRGYCLLPDCRQGSVPQACVPSINGRNDVSMFLRHVKMVAPQELNMYTPGFQPGVRIQPKPKRFGAIFGIGRDTTWKGYYHPAKIVTKRTLLWTMAACKMSGRTPPFSKKPNSCFAAVLQV
jgi:hypothetical protein